MCARPECRGEMRLDVCRVLLALVSLCIIPVSFAQTTIAIEIYGLDDELEKNARLFLSQVTRSIPGSV